MDQGVRRKPNAEIDAIDERLQDQESLSYAVLTFALPAGSINQKVRRYTNATVKGDDLSIQQSVTLGDSITILNTGMYEVSMNWRYSPIARASIERNTIIQTTSATWPDSPTLLIIGDTSTSEFSSATRTVELQAGDVIRSLTNLDSAGESGAEPHYLSVVRKR